LLLAFFFLPDPFAADLFVRTRVAEDEPEKLALKSKGLIFQEKEKRLSEC
jgi:hypothetical protein